MGSEPDLGLRKHSLSPVKPACEPAACSGHGWLAAINKAVHQQLTQLCTLAELSIDTLVQGPITTLYGCLVQNQGIQEESKSTARTAQFRRKHRRNAGAHPVSKSRGMKIERTATSVCTSGACHRATAHKPTPVKPTRITARTIQDCRRATAIARTTAVHCRDNHLPSYVRRPFWYARVSVERSPAGSRRNHEQAIPSQLQEQRKRAPPTTGTGSFAPMTLASEPGGRAAARRAALLLSCSANRRRLLPSCLSVSSVSEPFRASNRHDCKLLLLVNTEHPVDSGDCDPAALHASG